MKQDDITFVSKDKCPLDVLAEMKERTKNAWIFLHQNVVEKLMNSDGVIKKPGKKDGTVDLTWKATENFVETKVTFDMCSGAFTQHSDYKPIILISASDIAFTLMPLVPEEIIFLKMEE